MTATVRPTFTCPHCGRPTSHPDDVENRYCPRCHWWTGVPELYRPWLDERALRERGGDSDERPPMWAELDLWAVESSPSALVVSLTCLGCGGVITTSRQSTEERITLGRMLRLVRGTNHLDGCPVAPR